MVVAVTILLVCLGYVICGLLVGIPFILRGVGQVDPAARLASLGFRVLILPGTVALWPLILRNWLRASSTGEHA